MKTKTVVIIAVICGAVILLTKAKRGTGDFLKNLLEKIGNLSRDIIDGIKNFFKSVSEKLKINNAGGSNVKTNKGVGFLDGDKNKEKSPETVGWYNEETGKYIPESGYTDEDLYWGVKEGKYFLVD